MQFAVPIPLFTGVVVFSFGPDYPMKEILKATPKDWRPAIKDLYPEDPDFSDKAGGMTMFDDSGSGCSVIWLPSIPITTVDVAVLVHELSHAVSIILAARGVEDDETRAYLIGHLYHEAMTKVEKIIAKEIDALR